MIRRTLETAIERYSTQYPVVAIVGPRQSGKTTLARHMFPAHKYLSMENLDIRHMAEDDPRGFLEDYGKNLILDEIQRVPSLFSYLQERVDLNESPACYVLTGSQQFLLMERITQSLAGRIITFQLYPFSFNELHGARLDKDLDSLFKIKSEPIRGGEDIDIFKTIFTGMYPRIHDKKLEPRKWIENYILTCIERDIRSLVNVDNLKLFEDFLQTCAAMSGQLINYTSISNSIGVSQPTVKKWMSLLETSGILFILPPHHKNFRKRLVKIPKLYFADTGVLSFLLSIRTPDELKGHPLFGNIFETFIIGELYKRAYHVGEKPPFYFWRDKTGNEIDLLVDIAPELLPVEIKASKTYSREFKSSVLSWLNLKGNTSKKGFVIYRGKDVVGKKSTVTGVPWWYL
ncbi:MAG: ATP-binding protein [Deltaproteobacteria bacterium]|nr:ATP-binding protein [Deltaproteobacteria bacterium]